MSRVRLGDIARVFNGNSISAAEKDKHYRGAEGIPYIGTAEVGFDTVIKYDSGVAIPIAKLDGFKLAKAGTPLVCAEGGSAGRKVGFLDREACFGNKLFATEPSAGWVGKFLFYFFQSDGFRDQFRSLTTGLIGGVSIKKFKEIEVPQFPFEEQWRIVAILDEAIAAIAAATANAEKNLIIARELFDLFLAREFGGFGDRCPMTTIGSICKLRSGTTVESGLECAEGEIPYLKVADMSHPDNLEEVTSSSRFLRQSDLRRNSIIPPGATIFPKRGGAIMTNKKRLVTVPIAADLNIMSVIPGEKLDSKFLRYYFESVDMRRLGTGSSIPQINNYDIEPLLIPLPSMSEQAAFVVKTDNIQSATQALEANFQRKIDALQELKQSLLARAFRGRLHRDVSEPLAA